MARAAADAYRPAACADSHRDHRDRSSVWPELVSRSKRRCATLTGLATRRTITRREAFRPTLRGLAFSAHPSASIIVIFFVLQVVRVAQLLRFIVFDSAARHVGLPRPAARALGCSLLAPSRLVDNLAEIGVSRNTRPILFLHSYLPSLSLCAASNS